MSIHPYEFTPLRALWDTYKNYIWLLHSNESTENKSRACVIVDPGESDLCLETLDALNLTPVTILITHQHADHINGVASILNTFGALNVYGSSNNPFPLITHRVKEGDIVDLPEIADQYYIMETPGHTQDQISFYNDTYLISGDALFVAGCGRLSDGTMEQLYASVNKIKALPEKTIVYCAHEYTVENLQFALKVEPENQHIKKQLDKAINNDNAQLPNVPSTIEMEKKINPFMRSHIAKVKTKCEEYAQKELTSEFEVFSVLREWRG